MALVTTAVSVDDDGLPLLQQSIDGSDFVVCKSPEKLNRLLQKITTGKHVHFISDGDWSMHDLVMELVKKYQPCELFLTTYAIREFPIRQIIMAMDRKEITAVNILVDARAKIRTPEVYHLAENIANKIRLTQIHAKVTVLKSPAGSVTIVGSANWTTNPRIEAGVACLDRDVADFHIDWIKKAMDNGEIFE